MTGIRRCGKSTLFDIFVEYLKQKGVEKSHIILLNLESPDYNFKDYLELYHYVTNQIIDENKYYVILDEVQVVKQFEKTVDGLYIKKNIDVYITGSNALSGRYIEIKMLPLSFKEYSSFLPKTRKQKKSCI